MLGLLGTGAVQEIVQNTVPNSALGQTPCTADKQEQCVKYINFSEGYDGETDLDKVYLLS